MFGGGARCGACDKAVYAAEEVKAGGRSYHRGCFRCTTCKSGLQSNNLNDKEGKLYCNACYGKNFGPTGFGYGVGAGTLSNTGVGGSAAQAAPSPLHGPPSVPPPVPARQQQPPPQQQQQQQPPQAAPSSAPLPGVRAAQQAFGGAGAAASGGGFGAAAGGQGAGVGARKASAPVFGGAPKCPVCSKSVYHAEETKALGKSFHKQCLKCTSCSKSLDSVNLTERDGLPFCNGCYSKNFGPKGFGFGALNHTQ